MYGRFEYTTDLQYKVKTLAARLASYESGKKYTSMKSDFRSRLDAKNQEIKKLKLELADANKRTVTVRKYWQEVIEDLDNEHAKASREKDREIKSWKDRAFKSERQLDEARDKLREKIKELCQIKVELEEEKGKNFKLMEQLNRDYENSSTPSSAKPKRKIIANSREKTGKRPGGQPGHKGHGRKKYSPTNKIHIPAPRKYADSSDYRLTGKIITKQMVHLSVNVTVDEYSTPEFRNRHTGQRVRADFPKGVVNDVNYGGSVKAFAFLLNSRYCVAIDKAREFLSEITNGELQISKGMINGLSKEFSKKTQAERNRAFSELLRSPVMGVDFTGARACGKNVQIAVCANSDTIMYFAREHKGHKGVKGTPVEDYQGILFHDHDKTFYNYGNRHQECLAHILRYLKSSIDYEPDLKWNKLARELIREMIHYRNTLDSGDTPINDIVAEYEVRYLEILEIAKKEYEYEPPSDYYKDGYNLYRRLFEFKDSHLLFLKDFRVPHNNNLCERLLRVFKRKLRQVMTFRSFDSLEHLCDCLSVIALLRTRNQNLYTSVTSLFG